MSDKFYVALLLLVQLVCAIFVMLDIIPSMFALPIRPITWETKEFLQSGASVGLIIAVVLGAILLQRTLKRVRCVEERLLKDSDVLASLLYARVDDWNLTSEESEVALFALKGLPNSTIANLMGANECDIAAELNSICRKASVNSRRQLSNVFVNRLLSGEVLPYFVASQSRTAEFSIQ